MASGLRRILVLLLCAALSTASYAQLLQDLLSRPSRPATEWQRENDVSVWSDAVDRLKKSGDPKLKRIVDLLWTPNPKDLASLMQMLQVGLGPGNPVSADIDGVMLAFQKFKVVENAYPAEAKLFNYYMSNRQGVVAFSINRASQGYADSAALINDVGRDLNTQVAAEWLRVDAAFESLKSRIYTLAKSRGARQNLIAWSVVRAKTTDEALYNIEKDANLRKINDPELMNLSAMTMAAMLIHMKIEEVKTATYSVEVDCDGGYPPKSYHPEKYVVVNYVCAYGSGRQ